MSKEDLHLKEFVLFQLRRNVINLYKRYIILTEDLHKDHSIFLNKLSEEGVSENLLKKLDYFGDEKYTYIRKKILDIGNEVNRDLEKYFEMIEIELNKEKLEENQKVRVRDLLKFNKKSRIKGSDKGDLKFKGKAI